MREPLTPRWYETLPLKWGLKAELELGVLHGPSGLDEADLPHFKMQGEHHAAWGGDIWIWGTGTPPPTTLTRASPEGYQLITNTLWRWGKIWLVPNRIPPQAPPANREQVEEAGVE